MEELTIGLHVHSNLSDGTGTLKHISEAALKANLDVLITTDHNLWIQDLDGYYKKGRKRMMLLIGEEVHDNTLREGKNHLLVFGQNRELASFASDPQILINQAKRAGALTFLAHPIEDTLDAFGEKSFSWLDWNISGYTGIELWNQMSEFKTRSQKIHQAFLHAFFPYLMMQGPLERTLALWDHLLMSNSNPVVAIGGVDAHALHIPLGPFHVTLYQYEFQFRCLTTHIITPSKLTGALLDDKKMILDGLGAGHAFVAYDLPASTHGFRFTVNSKDGQFLMGDRVSARNGLTFQVRLPRRTYCRLIKDGTVIKEVTDREVLTHLTKDTGIYRAEVYLDFLGKRRGWIFSNPIYAVD